MYDRRLDLVEVLEGRHALKNDGSGLQLKMNLVPKPHTLTSFSGRVFVCLRRKSKSCPSIYSRTVQKLQQQMLDTAMDVHADNTYELESISKTS